jgi:hypothetical protein
MKLAAMGTESTTPWVIAWLYDANDKSLPFVSMEISDIGWIGHLVYIGLLEETV